MSLAWECRVAGGRTLGRAASADAAKRLAEHPWAPGLIVVTNIKTGEEWERRFGSWFLVQSSWPSKETTS